MKHIDYDPFERLLEMCESTILSSTWNYFLSDFEREDIEQEARKILVQSIHQFDPREGMGFLDYYEMSLGNHMRSLVRKDNTQKRIINKNSISLDDLVEETGANIQGTSSVTSYPEDAMITKELFSNFLIGLSPFEEKIFFLYLKGKSPEKISEKLGIEFGKVKNAMYRCSAKLKSMIN